MPREIGVLVMRRSELTPEEKQRLEAHYPSGTEFIYRQAAPTSPQEWLDICQRFEPDVVILPSEEPFPMPAIRQGYPHVLFSAEGIMLYFFRIHFCFMPVLK